MLTGGPKLAEVGAAAGAQVRAGGARHQVVVTAPVTAFDVHERADGVRPPLRNLLAARRSRRPAVGHEQSRRGRQEWRPTSTRPTTSKARDRIEELLPGRQGPRPARTWAATIDYTPDHLPILGPLLTDDGPVDGTVVASPAGHGMMWGPAVAAGGRRPDDDRHVRLARPHRPRPGPFRRRRQQSRCARTDFTTLPRESRQCEH